MTKKDKPSPFITTAQGISGFFAVMYWWNPDMGGFWEPYETGFGRYSTEDRAITEAQDWADAEDLEYVPRQKTKQEIIQHWVNTAEVLPPAKGDASYIGFPVLSEQEGQRLAEVTGTLFMMGEFVKKPPA